MKSEEEIIRAHFSRLGRSKSKAKIEALNRNRRKGHAMTSASLAALEAGYMAVRNGKASKTVAARQIAKTGYYRFLKYHRRREGGERPGQITSLY